MFTRFKGQGLIAEIMIFAMTVIMAIFIFFVLSSSNAEFEQNVETEIQSSMESINDRSVLTVILNNNVWRAPRVNERYNDLTALELTSYYFSIDEPVDIHGTEHKRSKVREDLKNYYSYKLRENFLNRPEQQDFVLNITDGDGKYLEIDGREGREGSWKSIRLPYQLSNEKVGRITLWIKGTGGVFEVE